MSFWRTLSAGVVAASSLACGSSQEGPSPLSSTEPPPVLAAPTAPLATVVNRNWGWVAPDPANPRYLRTGGESGQPFSIASYGTLVGCGFSADQVRRLKERGATYVVLWYQWSGCNRETPDWFERPWTGPWRVACDPRDPAQRSRCPDHPLWDLSQFDEQYWRTLDAMLTAAEDDRDGTNRKLVVRVHLFARQEFGIGRDDNPFRGVNNVNGVRSYLPESEARDPDLRYFATAAAECEAVLHRAQQEPVRLSAGLRAEVARRDARPRQRRLRDDERATGGRERPQRRCFRLFHGVLVLVREGLSRLPLRRRAARLAGRTEQVFRAA